MGGLSRLPTVYRNPKKAIKEWNSKLRKGIMAGILKKCEHSWELLGKTKEATYEWCAECGAIKETRPVASIYLPERAKK